MTTDTIEVSAPTRKTLGAQSPSIPRPHQINLLANIRGEIRNGGRRMAAQAVTGFGKTIVAATMAKGVLDRGNRVIFAVPALSLIDQTMTKFRAEGINEIGVIQADHPLTNPMMPVQIASVQTLMKREIPAADLVVIDEDYHEGDLGEAMNKNGLVADVVETWQRLGQGRPSLCFAVDRSHARNLQTQFLAAGVRCGYVDAYTTADERDEIRRQFHAGEIEIVTNVGVLTTGVDWDVGAIILARPTQSEMLFTRMIGRGLRTAEGKTDCLILDHSDNHERLGFVTDIHYDRLDDGTAKPKAKKRKPEKQPAKCPRCSFLKPPKATTCPVCAFTPKPICDVVVEDGELVEFAARVAEIDAEERRFFFAELRRIVDDRNYKKGWAAVKYRERFGFFPPWSWNDDQTAMPTATTLSWVKSRQIAYAMRRAS